MEKNGGTKPVKLKGSEILNGNEISVNDILYLKKSSKYFGAKPGQFKFQRTDLLKVKQLLNDTDVKKAVVIAETPLQQKIIV